MCMLRSETIQAQAHALHAKHHAKTLTTTIPFLQTNHRTHAYNQRNFAASCAYAQKKGGGGKSAGRSLFFCYGYVEKCNDSSAGACITRKASCQGTDYNIPFSSDQTIALIRITSINFAASCAYAQRTCGIKIESTGREFVFLLCVYWEMKENQGRRMHCTPCIMPKQ